MRIRTHAAGLLAGLLMAVEVSQPAQAEPPRLRYGIWVGYGPLFVAREKGFFAKEGVEVEPIRIDDLTAAFASLFDDHVDSMMVSRSRTW
jgi:NitT/TauT family transport system substrate-binding protein